MWSLQSLRRLISSCNNHQIGGGLGVNLSQMLMTSTSSSTASSSMIGESKEQKILQQVQHVQPNQLILYPSLYSSSALAVLVKGMRINIQGTNFPLSYLILVILGLPEMLLRQYEYEDPIVRGGKHLLHSSFFKELTALACEIGLDGLPGCSETFKWAWFRRFCIASRYVLMTTLYSDSCL